MCRLLLYVFLILVSTRALWSTDFVAESLVVTEISPGVFGFSVTVHNNNVLDDTYSLRIDVYKAGSETSIWSTTVERPLLASFQRRVDEIAQRFTTVDDTSYVAEVNIEYEADVDPTNNSRRTTFQYVREVDDRCRTSRRWHAGTPFRIVKNLTVFPDRKQLYNKLRPGDVIAISADVRDEDVMIQNCGCGEADTSVTYGTFPDEVQYEWSLKGKGRLVTGRTPTTEQRQVFANTVLYQIPECDTLVSFNSFDKVEISLTVRNAGSTLAFDAPLTGKVVLDFNIGRDPGDPIPEGAERFRNAYFVHVHHIDTLSPISNPAPTLGTASSCIPRPPRIRPGTGIQVTDYIGDGLLRTMHAETPNLCPEYLSLYTAPDAVDLDSAIVVCAGSSGACFVADTIRTVHTDAVEYHWDIVSGPSRIVGPTVGQSVAIHRSRTANSIVRCRIRNSERSEAQDPEVVILDTIAAVGSPVAYVAKGDDDGISIGLVAQRAYRGILKWMEYSVDETDEVYPGRSFLIQDIYDVLKSRLEGAGYRVIEADTVRPNDISTILAFPCVKHFAFAGHGSSGSLTTSRYFDSNRKKFRNETYQATAITNVARTQFQCSKHPYLRRLSLMACESSKVAWDNRLLMGDMIGWAHATNIVKALAWTRAFFWPDAIINTID